MKLRDNIYVQSALQTIVIIVAAILFCLIIELFCSCRTCKPVTSSNIEYVYTDNRDTLRDVKLRIDSVVLRDSIVTIIKGDSVFIDRWHSSYKVRERVDTVEKIRYATIYRTRTITNTVAVEKKLGWWQSALIWCGGVGVTCTIILILGYLNRFIKKKF